MPSALLRAFVVCMACATAAPVHARDNPRLAAIDYQVATYNQPAVRVRLADFDLLVLGFWRGYGAARIAPIVKDLRSRHPGIRIGQYTVLNEVPGGTRPDEANHDLIEKLDRENWWLRDDSGNKLQWTSAFNAYDVNLTAWVKPDENGMTWPQWKAQRDVKQLFAPWPSLDFVFLDNVFHAPRERAVWRAGAGLAARDDAAVAASLRRGYVSYVQALRHEVPDLPVIGNVDHDLSAPEYHHVFDGAFLESLIGRRWSIEGTRGWLAMMARYRNVSTQVRDPRLVVFHMSGSASDYRLMRYGLASCLMGDGLFAYSADDAPMPPWFDEFDVDLGPAEGGAQQAPGGDAWMRRFARGLVVVNPGPQPAVVALPPGYKHLKGTQVPEVNNGEAVRELRLAPRDGVILMRSVS